MLVLHLKRFEFKHALGRDKLDTFVDFPLEGLDMNKHCGNWESPGDGDKPFVDAGILAEYDLFGAINHYYGRLGFWHYTQLWHAVGTRRACHQILPFSTIRASIMLVVSLTLS
jgi:hypothetical protein